MRLYVKIACILIIGAVASPDMASATKTISYNIKSMSRQQLDKWCGNHNGYPIGTDKPAGTYECNGGSVKGQGVCSIGCSEKGACTKVCIQ